MTFLCIQDDPRLFYQLVDTASVGCWDAFDHLLYQLIEQEADYTQKQLQDCAWAVQQGAA